MKRILLFVLTNFAVMAVLLITTRILGVDRFLTANGLNMTALAGFSLVIGFGGAIISLLISKPMAKFSTGARVINQPQTADEAWIVETVRRFADKAGIGMPEVAIFEGAPNAFATGAFKNSALVAVSTGLLQNMTKEEVEAVIGHEVAHVANGDMVTMTLIQGVMNTFVVFLSRLIGYAVDAFLRRGSDSNSGPGIGYMITTIVMDIVLGFLAAIIVAWFSRQREFRADAGAAGLMGRKQPMINALARLGGLTPGELPKTMQALGITGGLGKLFSTHPPIEERIAALQKSLTSADQTKSDPRVAFFLDSSQLSVDGPNGCRWGCRGGCPSGCCRGGRGGHGAGHRRGAGRNSLDPNGNHGSAPRPVHRRGSTACRW
jgi:heat shock protein HtpX